MLNPGIISGSYIFVCWHKTTHFCLLSKQHTGFDYNPEIIIILSPNSKLAIYIFGIPKSYARF